MTAPTNSALVALNLGSATLKAALFLERDGLINIARATVPGALVRVDEIGRDDGNEVQRYSKVLDRLLSESDRWSATAAVSPAIVAHRIVHGGDRAGPVVLSPATLHDLAALAPLAPIHQGPALALARAAMAKWPEASHVAVFDTAWHRTLEPFAATLPLSAEIRARGVRRYGFHGIAFQSALAQLRRAQPDADEGRVVLAHLGGGSSLCAVTRGRSIDTTMGMTPLDGLPMATRSGSLDPGVVLYMQRTLGMTPDAVEDELSLRSGLLGISDVSGDMQTLLRSDRDSARLAVNVFVLRVAQGIAAMAATLGGDDIVFSGGIGSHADPVREAIAARLRWIGVELDPAANARAAPRIDSPTSTVRVWVVVIDEERELASAAMTLLTVK